MSDWQGGSYERQSASEQLLRHAKNSSPKETATPDASGSNRSTVTPLTSRSGGKETTGASGAPNPVSPDDLEAGLDAATTGEGAPLASEGWRAGVNRWSAGLLKLSAGPVEQHRLADERDCGVQLSRPMTITVANPKGSSTKTPVTAMLAAILGRHRGSGVVAWDNNENQGTLGLRTGEGRFPSTVVDLLREIEQFENGQGRLGDLGRFVRHQQVGPFDVLASAEDSGQMANIGREEFTRLHSVLTTFYQLVVVDSGNGLLSPNWLAAADATDVLVIPLRWSFDHVRSAERMIDQLRASGRSDLVDNAITVISHGGGATVDKENAPRWREWFETNTAEVLEVPYDGHIAAGSRLRFDRLAAPTQRAFLALGASVSRSLAQLDNPYLSSKGTL
ncbi:MAG: MinD/ParA family ATP-binding protein [Brachybacterium tyrofermentans]